MSTTTSHTTSAPLALHVPPLPPLEQGDHLDQKTFHARYEAMPQGTRAELIGGIVYMPSPAKSPHGRAQSNVVGWVWMYDLHTPHTKSHDNTTDILGDDSEPQPDAFLMIATEKGGSALINEDEYVEGPPELIAEVASATESYDLHSKKRDYEKYGVQEYVVFALRQSRVFWHVLRDGKYQELAAGDDGIYRSQVFPGLWLDGRAVLEDNGQRLLEVLQQGLASKEHAEFVARLGERGT